MILIKELIFSTDFQKVENSMEICQVEAELFHADGQTDMQTDMTELIVAFCNFAKAFKSQSVNNVEKFWFGPYREQGPG